MIPARQPVPPLPHPGARRDQHHQQRPRPSRSRSRTNEPSGAVTRTSATGAPGGVPTGVVRLRRAEARAGSAEYDGRRTQRPAPQVTVGEQRVVAAGRARHVASAARRRRAAAAATGRRRAAGRRRPRAAPPGSCRAAASCGAVVPGQGEFPGEVVGVPQPLVEALGAERAEQMRGVPGEEGPADPPAPGEPVVDGVDAGVEQLVRRCGLAAPAGQGVPDAGHQGLGGDQVLPGGSSQSSRQTPSGSGRAVTSAAGPDVRHGGCRCSNASPGQGSSARSAATACRSTAVRPGKRMSRSLRTVERGAVAADQVAAAPPGAPGAAGVRRDAVAVLLERVEPAVRGRP